MKDRWTSGRTEAFSDGVFAIAITLLVLELSVPHDKFSNLWRGIGGQWPSYLAYATSFLTIGGIWLAHHSLFIRLHLVNRRLMQLNLVLLMTVSFLPFPTRLVAEAIREKDAERAAVIFYGILLLLVSLIVAAMWRLVVHSPVLWEDGVDTATMQRSARAATPSIGFYAFVIAVALLAPQVAAFGYLVIAVLALFTVRGESDRAADRAGERRPGRRFRRWADH